MNHCPHCTATFARLSHLTRHVRGRHTKVTPFRCLECEKKFSRYDTLLKHLRNVHFYGRSFTLFLNMCRKQKLTPEERDYVCGGFTQCDGSSKEEIGDTEEQYEVPESFQRVGFGYPEFLPDFMLLDPPIVPSHIPAQSDPNQCVSSGIMDVDTFFRNI